MKTIHKRLDTFDNRFDSIDNRFELIDKKFDSIDKKFDSIDKKFESIDNRFESFDKRFETFDKRFESFESGQRQIQMRLELFEKKQQEGFDNLGKKLDIIFDQVAHNTEQEIKINEHDEFINKLKKVVSG